jgi:D-methionine transport system substrate-binding protein
MTHYADLNPIKDAILLEDGDSPYSGVFGVKASNKDKPGILRLMEAFRSETVAKLINDKFRGIVIPAFPFRS